MKKSKISLTIGIPAYNEYNNLLHLIPSIAKQKCRYYQLSKIIINSDNSNDLTSTLSSEFPNLPIQVLIGRNQKGKPFRVNQILQKSLNSVVIILDADVNFRHQSVLDDLVKPIASGTADLTSGIAVALKPINSIQHIAWAGVKIWNTAREMLPPNNIYNSEGMLRCFNVKVVAELRFPPLANIEDTYPYLMSVVKKWKFKFVPSAQVGYLLPSSLHDYRSQQRRYHTSVDSEILIFPVSMLNKHRILTFKIKIRALIKYFLNDPLWTFLYLIFSVYLRFDMWLNPAVSSSTWEVLTTTKKPI